MVKQINEAIKQLEKDKIYSINEAIDLAKKLSYEKFDPSLEVSFNLNLNVKKAEQQLRGSIVLPYGTGKVAKVLVVADKSDQDDAKSLGADYVGDEQLLEKMIKENNFDFSFIVTTPKYMAKIAKHGKVLGPKGLMPNPKLGTVTQDVKKAVEDIKNGKVEYRTNNQGMINIAIGKASFTTENLVKNYETIFKVIKSRRPSTVKGDLIKSIYISTTMGPGLKVSKDGGLK